HIRQCCSSNCLSHLAAAVFSDFFLFLLSSCHSFSSHPTVSACGVMTDPPFHTHTRTHTHTHAHAHTRKRTHGERRIRPGPRRRAESEGAHKHKGPPVDDCCYHKLTLLLGLLST